MRPNAPYCTGSKGALVLVGIGLHQCPSLCVLIIEVADAQHGAFCSSSLLWVKLRTMASMLANCHGHFVLYKKGLWSNLWSEGLYCSA